MVIIIIYYCGPFPFRSSSVQKNLRMVIILKWHAKISHTSNTFPTPSRTTVALIYTILYYRDPLAADEGTENTAQPYSADHMEIMRAGDEKQVILL